MKITLVAVCSLDGKITQGKEVRISSWTSSEDKVHFSKQIKYSSAVIMGRKTYEAISSFLRLDPKILRIVLTKNPSKYESQALSGQLEFSSETPEQLSKKLARLGKDSVLLAGGSEIYSLFLKASLVDEIQLTIEPVIFGSGQTLLQEIPKKIKTKLISSERLNKQGTMLLKYAVMK